MNIGTIVVIFIIVLLLALVVVYLVKQKRAGRCASCPYYNNCGKSSQCDDEGLR
ncbi:MAG: FeoB-associated Cys-rich membrane protein [Ruminococcus sp.]|nr:FeoB-associated Cys-rich membrane protein [Ruminococcus sp.]